MFKTAKPIAAVKVSAAKKTKLEVQVDTLKQLAELQALQKAIAGIESQLVSSIKEFALDTFITEGNKIERRPENFKGVDGIASASVELRQRASNSPLTPEQVTLLATHGLVPEKVVTVTAMFGINPIYSHDDKLLDAVTKALEGIVPEDFIVQQEEVSKLIVTEQMVNEAFKKGIPREVVETVSVLALKPKLESVNMTDIIASVTPLLTADADDEAHC